MAISCLITLIVTVIIPLRQTYRAVRQNTDTKLWSIYWAFFTLFRGIFFLIPFLEVPPITWIFTMFLAWLYYDTFKGALFLEQFVTKQLEANPAIATNINMIASKAKFLNLFESEQPVPEKPKTA